MAITSKGGYTEIARVLHEALADAGVAVHVAIGVAQRQTVTNLTRKMADLFENDNPRGFDPQRFYAAVGIIPSEENNNGTRL